jgi:ATP-binding cassette subfamily F protein uup
LLARLFARPANVLVLDEPTNDLDIDTLELLEELLQGYEGTVFLVSHDRRFLDGVVTSVIAYEGNDSEPGLWREYEGGVSDWLIQSARARTIRAASAPAQSTDAPPGVSKPAQALTPAATGAKRKLSYKEQREWDALPQLIETLEREQKSLDQILSEGSVFASDPQRAAELSQRAAQVEEELMQALMRWEALEH